MELDDIRLKEADDLTNDEKGFLKEHKDELTDEDRDTFKDVVDFEDAEGKEGKEGEEGEGEGKKEEEFKFKSKDEFDEAVASGVTKAIESREQARREAEERKKAEEPDKEPDRIFPEGYKAPDWEEAAQRILEVAEARQTKRQTDVRTRLDAIDREYDNQIVKIRESNVDLPAKGTKEGNKFEAELAEIGTRFRGVTDMNEAYEIWEAKQSVAKAGPGKRQKELVSKVGKSGGSGGKTEEMRHRDIASKSMDELLEARMEKEGIAN